MKQKILIVTWMGGGNTRPVLSMASDLVAMGHTVHILSNPDMRARSEKTGAVFHPFRRIPPHNPGSPETDIIRAFEGCSVGEINRLIADRFVLGLARPIALDTADAIEAARADIVASDYTMPGAMIAAERAGCCLVLTADGEYPIPIPQEPQYASRYAYLFARILAEGLSASGPLCALRANWGMQAIETPHDLIGRAARVLVMTYPVLSGGREPPGAVYVGPQFEPPATLPPPADRKTVFGTFSTIATPEQDRFVTALARASANDQRHMLLACGASQPVSNAFVRAERFVDFPAVLPDVRLALSHSGNGTVTFLLASRRLRCRLYRINMRRPAALSIWASRSICEKPLSPIRFPMCCAPVWRITTWRTVPSNWRSISRQHTSPLTPRARF